jgi:hypothetical protein
MEVDVSLNSSWLSSFSSPWFVVAPTARTEQRCPRSQLPSAIRRADVAHVLSLLSDMGVAAGIERIGTTANYTTAMHMAVETGSKTLGKQSKVAQYEGRLRTKSMKNIDKPSKQQTASQIHIFSSFFHVYFFLHSI